MAESLVWLDLEERTSADPAEDETTVLIHGDAVTPEDHMISALQTIFGLSDELAEHITWVAHRAGAARVVTRPRYQAQRLVDKAHTTARLYGFPLTFSLEIDGRIPATDSRTPIVPFAVRVIVLLAALLLAVSLALADGAGAAARDNIAPRPESGVTTMASGGDVHLQVNPPVPPSGFQFDQGGEPATASH